MTRRDWFLAFLLGGIAAWLMAHHWVDDRQHAEVMRELRYLHQVAEKF